MKKLVRKCLLLVMVSSLLVGITIGGINVNAAKRVRLENIGRSCYFNSAIQSIYASNYLREKAINIYDQANLSEEDISNLTPELACFFKITEVLKAMKDAQEENDLLDGNFLRSKIDKFVNHENGGDSFIDVILNFLNSINKLDECLCGGYALVLGNSFALHKPQLDPSIREGNLGFFFLSNSLCIKNLDAPLVYDLGDEISFEAQSIIVDTGGHSVCFVKQDDGCWICFNDTNISERTYTFEEVVGVGTIETIFYEMK